MAQLEGETESSFPITAPLLLLTTAYGKENSMHVLTILGLAYSPGSFW